MKRINIVFCLLLVLFVAFGCSGPIELNHNEKPNPPENVNATEIKKYSVTLIWTASIDIDGIVTNYNIYMNETNAGSVKKLAVKTVNTNITINGLLEDKSYYFTVKSVDNWGFESEVGSQIMIRTLPSTLSTPTGIWASDGSFSHRIHITWDYVENATTYHVFRSSNNDGIYTEIGITTNMSFDDTNMNMWITNYYKVKASIISSISSELSDYDIGHSGSGGLPLYYSKWGNAGTGDGEFNDPMGIAVDTNNYIYVADTYNSRIQKFTADGVFITSWGTLGSGNGEFNRPYSITTDQDCNIYVADTYNGRIQKFTSNGVFITSWGSPGTDQGEFNTPRGVVADSNGYIYVADYLNYRIQKFTSDGVFVTMWGSRGSLAGEFDIPRSIAVGINGNIYVADSNNQRIQVFTSDGAFINSWDVSVPYRIAIDSSNYVYISHQSYGISKFTPTGEFVTNLDGFGANDGEFNNPMELVIDSQGYVYIVDAGNNRIQKFE